MKKFKNVAGLLVAFLAVMFFGSGMTIPVNAEEVPAYRIGVTPTQQAFPELKPGEEYQGSFKVRNTGSQELDFEISFSPYSISDEAYNPNFSNTSSYTSLKDWISVEESSGHANAGQEQEIKYTIKVPEDAHGGTQMAAIMATAKNASNSSGSTAVETVKQVAYLVYGNVDGEIKKSGLILENKIPTFFFSPPITVTSVVENTGNIYTAAEYKLQVFPLFSDEEVYTNEEEPEKNMVFPDTKRMHQISWDGAPQLGIFKVKQTVKIFDEESVVEKIVFLCPIWFIFIVLAIVFCVIFWLISRIIRRKHDAE